MFESLALYIRHPVSGRTGVVRPTRKLRSSSWTQCHISELGQDARHLHAIQLIYERNHLRDKFVFHQIANFFLAIPLSTCQQIRHGDL